MSAFKVGSSIQRCWKRLSLLTLLLALAPPVAAQADCDPAFDAECKRVTNTEAQSVADKVPDYPPYHGPKHVIAVLPFTNRVQNVYGSANIGEGLSEILITELLRTNRYLIVEREAIQQILKEQELGMTGLARKGTTPATGQLAGTQFMIRGSVTEFNEQAEGGGITFGFSKAEIGHKSHVAKVGIDVRIVDNATGQILASHYANAEAKSSGLTLAARIKHNSDNFKVGTSGFESTALGEATRTAVRTVVSFIMEQSQHIPWQGSIIKSGRGKTYVNRGTTSNLKVGDRLVVYSKGEPLIDPETGFNLGSEEERLCGLTVSSVKEKFSIARQGPDCRQIQIERGFLVRFE